MSRDPWIRCQQDYLDAIRNFYAPRTVQTMERGFRSIYKAFKEMKAEGMASTTNPRRLTREDIASFMDWMRNRKTRNGIGLALATQANYMDYLNGFLRFESNGVLDQMRKLHYVRFPQKVTTEVRVMPESRVEELRSKLKSMPGYKGEVARFIVAMYAYSGLRRSELRRARLEDLSLDSWTIIVAHPKGESSWAVAAPAQILPPARKAVVDFLKARELRLSAEGIDSCEALVPKVTNGIAEYWSDGMWGKLKAEAEKWSGIKFRLQTLRATFGQMCIDWGCRPDAVSRALRHKTTRTTELYYARIRADHAFRLLEQAYDSAHHERRAEMKAGE